MEKICKARLRELLEEEKVSVEVAAGGRTDCEDSYELGFMQDLVIQEGGSQLKYKGYTVETLKGKRPVSKVFKTIAKLFSYLERKKVFDGDEVAVITYQSQFPTYQAYLEALAFDHIDMAEILDKYLPYADRFSLTYPYCTEIDKNHPFGTYRLSETDADDANKKIREVTLRSLLQIYEKMSDEEKKSLPPFETLTANIEREIEAYRRTIKEQELDDCGGSAFMCDQFLMKETQYTSPQDLWHFYHDIDNLFMFQWISDRLRKNTKESPLDAELNDEYYLPLKCDLEKIEVTFCWHCTISSQLSKVFYFRLTEHSLAWLKKLKNDYDMKKLEDLAFYKGDKVLFSSCTHECFHSDCMKDFVDARPSE